MLRTWLPREEFRDHRVKNKKIENHDFTFLRKNLVCGDSPPPGISTASSTQLHTSTVLPFFRRPKREARLRGGRALSDQLDVLPFSAIGDVLPFWCHQLDVLPFQGSPGIRASLFWTVSSIRSTCFPFQWSGNDQGDVLPFSPIVTRKFEISFKSFLTRHAKGKHEELGSS